MQQIYDYFLVLDFEATCSDTNPKFQNEIIEFPIVVLNAKTGEIEREFQEYVKPVLNPILTKFCTTLTGIEQKTVDEADTFENVFNKVQIFMKEFFTEHQSKSIFVTCGDWDLIKMLPKQAQMSNVKIPKYFSTWINIKVPFREEIPDFLGGKSGGIGMPQMLHSLNLPLKGSHHSGIDDARNIASIVYELIKRGVKLEATYNKTIKIERG